MRRNSLGKGLAALIPEMETPSSDNGVAEIDVTVIVPNPYQPRKDFKEGSLQELVQSIKEHGVVQPVVVTRHKDKYQLVVGERRWRAAMEAGLTTIPAIVKELSKKEKMEIALVENLQREDLNPIEEAEGYNLLIGEFRLTQEELSQRIGKSRPYVTNIVRLLNLPLRIKELVLDGSLTAGHARALLSLVDESLIIKISDLIIKDNLSVRQTENLVKKVLDGGNNRHGAKNGHVEYAALNDLEQRLQFTLGTKVQILAKEGDRGKIELHYFSKDDFEKIISVLLSKEWDNRSTELSLL